MSKMIGYLGRDIPGYDPNVIFPLCGKMEDSEILDRSLYNVRNINLNRKALLGLCLRRVEFMER